jgi:predicted ATPase
MYDPGRHASLALVLGIDHRVMSSNFLGLTLWVLGEDAAARDLLQRNLAWAEALDHGHSQAQALTFGCTLLTMLEDWQAAAAMAERGAALSHRLGFPVLAAACDFFGVHAQARHGDDAATAAGPMRQAAERVWATGVLNYRPLMELLLARVQAAAGDAPSAGALLASAFATVEQSGERWFEPELWRFRGELWPAHRADDLRRARDLAHHQKAGGLLRRAEAALAAHGPDSSGGAPPNP